MINLCDNVENCSGCGVCEIVCPFNAISLREDKLARIIPLIDENKCRNCGLCEDKCHAIDFPQLYYPQACYAAIVSDEQIYSTTSSGGMGTVFAEEMLNKVGIVYGAAFVAPTHVRHVRVKNIEEMDRLKGSKYVFSNTNGIFKNVLQDLESANRVLFIGTPCQISALKKYLGKDYDNLITVDLICHGTPPEKYFSEHISSMVKNRKITDVSFRKKTWHLCIESDQDILYKRASDEDTYFTAFLKGVIFRENCYSCRYAQIERCADITIGDFWGLGETRLPSKAKSIVLVNTNKGMNFWNEVSPRLDYEKRTIEEGKKGNSQLNMPSIKPNERFVFEKTYDFYRNEGFEKAMKVVGITKKCEVNRRKRKVSEMISKGKCFVKRFAKGKIISK